MRNSIAILLGLCLFIQVSSVFAQEADGKEENKKLDLKFYGFIKGDMVYSTAGVNSFGAGSLAAPQVANGVEQSALGFTAQHSRLGLKSTVGEAIKVGGLVELDFFGNSFDANTKPRLRQGYASLHAEGLELRVGQQWDIFSPNNATTNNTNGNMWFAGNHGFRRAQIQLSYTIALDDITPMVQLSVGETTREESGLGKDNLSGVPMFQARVSAKVKDKFAIGLSYVNGQLLEKGTSGLWNYDFKVKVSGVGVDINLPFHKMFTLVGEFNTGTNLNNANLFSVAGNHSFAVNALTGAITDYNKENMGMWVNASSQLASWLTATIGYGMDINQSDKFAVNATESNSVFYGNLTLPIKHGFALMLEYQNISTKQITGVDANGSITDTKANKANVIGVAARVSF